MKPNAELAYKVLDHIDTDPKSWAQSMWYTETTCGTKACFAGWTVLLAGHEISPDPTEYMDYSAIDGDENALLGKVAISDLGLQGVTVKCRCTDRCRLRVDASQELFGASNSREDLGELVREIFGPRPEEK